MLAPDDLSPQVLSALRAFQARDYGPAQAAFSAASEGCEDEGLRTCLQGLGEHAQALESLREGAVIEAFHASQRAKAKLRKAEAWVAGIGVEALGASVTAFQTEARLADRVRDQLTGGVAPLDGHVQELPSDLPARDRWPVLSLSEALQALLS